MLSCDHPVFNHFDKKQRGGKVGSLQKFIDCDADFDELSHSLFSDFEVQKIALLDLRILNCDRNAANILVKHSTDSEGEYVYELIPIDHGYSIPSRLKVSDLDWVWFECDHIKRPVCEEIKNYVSTLDIDSIILKVLETIHLTDEHIYLLQTAHHFVVNGIQNGLSLYDIAKLMARSFEDEEKPSKFETAFSDAEDTAIRYFDLKLNNHGQGRSRSNSINPNVSDVNETHPTTNSSLNGSELKRLTSMCELSIEIPDNHLKINENVNSKYTENLSNIYKFPLNEIHRVIKSDEKVVSEVEHNSNHLMAPAYSLSRVVSFAGFNSRKIYSPSLPNKYERQLPTLLRNQTELFKSNEFKTFRLEVSIDRANALINIEIKRKELNLNGDSSPPLPTYHIRT